jgi:hypothetical protein
MRQRFGMQEAAVSDDNISFGNGSAIKPLAALLIGAMFTDRDQASVAMFNEAKPFGGKIKGAEANVLMSIVKYSERATSTPSFTRGETLRLDRAWREAEPFGRR